MKASGGFVVRIVPETTLPSASVWYDSLESKMRPPVSHHSRWLFSGLPSAPQLQSSEKAVQPKPQPPESSTKATFPQGSQRVSCQPQGAPPTMSQVLNSCAFVPFANQERLVNQWFAGCEWPGQ